MFAERGLRATTVRDIADAAGILSGSLYHHFESKEEMVDEVLRDFLDWLFGRYQQIIDTEPNPLARLKGLFMASFDAIDHHHAEVVIYQDEAKRPPRPSPASSTWPSQPAQRKMWIDAARPRASTQGCFRPDLDVDLVYRFIRDTTWVSVRWYTPGGPLTAEEVGRSTSRSFSTGSPPTRQGDLPCLRHTSSTRSAPRWASATARWPACIRSTSACTRFRGIFDRNDVDPAAVDDAIVGLRATPSAVRPATSVGCTWLAAGYPDEVPGVTVDRQCGSSQQAISFGAQAIMAGTADLILAGGMQNMSQIPISSAMIVGEQFGFTTPTAESQSWLAPLRRPGDLPVPRRGDDRREVGHLPRGHGARSRWPATSGRSPRSAAGHFDNEIVAGRTTSRSTRARARHRWRRWPGCQHAQ